jgi:hypothetical protein
VSAWDHRHTAFLFGFFGGLAINILRLSLLSQQPESDRPEFGLIYWIQFFGLALLGGILAIAHDLSQPINALVSFNLGLSVPSLTKVAADLVLPGKAKRRAN